MTSASEKRTEVNFLAGPETEIVVTNATRTKLGSSIGGLALELAPGLYKVRFKAGSAFSDQVFEVGDSAMHLVAPRLAFSSPVPLAGTGTTHEYQEDGARALSGLVPEKIGAGSEIALFARDSAKHFNAGPAAAPWRGLALQRLSGITDVDFSATGNRDPDRGFGASRVELDPGAFLLTLERTSGPILQLPLVASAGWRTTVFTDCTGPAGNRQPDLYGASVIVTRLEDSFEPYDNVLCYAELAKQSLAAGRAMVNARSLSNMLDIKFEYPMVGILAGHVLLLAEEPDYGLLHKVVHNLEKLVPGHPDVLALRIALLRGTEAPGQDDLRLDLPPMLRSSWDVFVAASERLPRLMPVGAEWMKYAYGLSGSQVWLAWQRPPAPEKKGFTAGMKGAGKPDWDSGLTSIRRAAHRDEPLETTIARLAETAQTLLVAPGSKLSRKQVASVWGVFARHLISPTIASSPLQNSLRRWLLAVLEDSESDDATITLSGIAKDLRVPVPVLIEAANALFTALSNRAQSDSTS